MSDNPVSKALFERAVKVMPGGVNSPVRAYRSVGGDPLFIAQADGSRVFDADGNAYIDYVGSWGPMLLGHNHPAIRAAVQSAAEAGMSFGAPTEMEVRLAEQVIAIAPGVDMLRMVNSGTEAVMGALRLARAYTGRDKVIKFAGCYHGHTDSMLVKAGSGALTGGRPDSLGVPEAVAADTLVAEYNDLDSVQALLEGNAVAAVIVEPLAANMGVVAPGDGFLAGLADLAHSHGALLVFDEVITGFRLAPGGAQEYYGVAADIVTYGKVIGGGLPVGAYGGRRELMELVAPLGGVYQAGTLSGNPLAMAAGLAQIQALGDPALYAGLETLGGLLQAGLNGIVDELGCQATITRVGSLMTAFFGVDEAKGYQSVKGADTAAYASFFKRMLRQGVYLAPSQFEAMFISAAHGVADIDATLAAARSALLGMRREGEL
jgi:glutamate-1-semialdehyde 2,1-aminomutase